VKYDFLIEQSLKATSLKKVRIKVDPSLVSTARDLSECDGYEGYILAECGNIFKVLIISPDNTNAINTIEVAGEHLEDADDEMDVIKAFIEFILRKYCVDVNSPLAMQLFTANSIEMIEAALKQQGHSDEDVKILYRDFITDEADMTVNEGFGNLLSKGWQATKKAAVTAQKAAAATAGVAGGLTKAAGATLGDVGSVYSALGGEKGGALLKSAGGKIKAAGNALTSLKTTINDRIAQDALKKLYRPQGDPKLNQSVLVNLPDAKLVDQKLAFNKIQTYPDRTEYTIKVGGGVFQKMGRLAAKAKLPQSLPVDQLVVIDSNRGVGTSSVNIFAYKFDDGGRLKPASDVKPQISGGLHYTNTGWTLDDRADDYVDFAQLRAAIADTNIVKLNDDIKKKILGAKDTGDIRSTLDKNVKGMNDNLYTQILIAASKSASRNTGITDNTPPTSRTNTVINNATPGNKPKPDEVLTFNNQKYIWGGNGWTLPKKDNPKQPGKYVRDTLLKKQLNDAWTQSKA
jgi:hypothetical protein